MASSMRHNLASRPCSSTAGCSSSSSSSRILTAPRRTPAAAGRQQRQLQPLSTQPQQHQQQLRRQQLLVVFAAAPDSADADAFDPSIPAVDQDFDLLGAEVKKLQEALSDQLKGCSIYLIGMMGTGKSTTGKMLANTLKYAFFDTDNVIEMAHPGESVSDIFKKYGEEYFRNCESQVLKELAPYKNLVVATGGGAVSRPKNWSYMHNGIVAWLQGQPDLLARRVVAEGIEKRPLLFGDGVSEDEAYSISLQKLQQLLADRTKFYENADVTVDLRGYAKDEQSGAPAAVVLHRLMQAVHEKINQTEAERESRRQFTIDRAGEVPSLKVQSSPNAAAQPAAEE
ncbi:shikimate kinase-domain-containing protein [Scenedesmus sp. NREL 46B-D3]|nr:shikimate kinase-domain-containing protein [Scenedesmus sp. NREL 46B-D3]